MDIEESNIKKIKYIKSNWIKKAETQKRIFVFFAVGPAFAAYLLFNLYPNLLSVYYSLLEWNGLSKAKFIGLFNYIEMIKDPFMWRALYHNLILILVVPVFIIMISVVLSDLLINRGIRESRFYKLLFFFPNVISTVVIGLLWSFIYDGDFGLFNALLRIMGIDVGKTYWLGDRRTALVAVLLPIIWSGVGFYIIIFMNAMASIPKSLYEASDIEGATSMTKLFRITIPLISGVIRVGTIFIILGLLKGFDLILVLTRGGPAGATDVISLYMFNFAFGNSNSGASAASNYSNYGYASAIGMFLFVVLIGTKLLTDKFFSKDTIEY